MKCGSLDPFPAFFEKFNKNSFLIWLPKSPPSLQFFKQFAVAEPCVEFCKVPTYHYYLVHNESIDMSSFSIDVEWLFSYQSIDCLFTTSKYHFPCITQIKRFVFQKLLSAIDFRNSLQFPVLTKLSFTKKTTPTQEIQNKTHFPKRVLLHFLEQIRHLIYFSKVVRFWWNQKSVDNFYKLCMIYHHRCNNVKQRTVSCLFQMDQNIQKKQSHQFQCTECPASFTITKKLTYHSAAERSTKSSNAKFQYFLCDLSF